MRRRLVGAIVDGLGLSMGKRLFDEAAEQVEQALIPEDPAAAKAREAAAERERRAAEKTRKAEDKARAKAEVKAARAVESELAALKRKVARER